MTEKVSALVKAAYRNVKATKLLTILSLPDRRTVAKSAGISVVTT